MPISDKKKVQTFINVVGRKIATMRALRDDIAAMRTKYQTQSVDPTGTPLEGNEARLNSAFNTLSTQLDVAVFTGLINAVVITHNDQALDQE